jgi:dephospho-CoA kinase
MLTVGLTGGIACGKSTVAKEFKRLGAYIIDADELARQAIEPKTAAWQKIADCFGPKILKADRQIDRNRLAEIVFADKDSLTKLNEIVHPPVMQAEKKLIADITRRDPEALIIVEVPLLIETGHQQQMQRVIVVAATPDNQLQRLLGKGFSQSQAWARINAQLSITEKIRYADFVIFNNGSLQKVYKQVKNIFTQLKLLT